MANDRTRYPVATWVAGTIITVVLAIGVRVGAALLDVEVVVERFGDGAPAPVEFGPLVVVTLALFLLAAAGVLVLDRLWSDRSRRVVRFTILLLLLASIVSIVLGETPTDALVVVVLLHLVAGVGVLRTIVRE